MAGDTTIVTCIEAGPLEAQVLLLAESLRTFGGAWSGTDFIAVKPRRGPDISSGTKRELRRLGVEFIDQKFNAELDWWNNANKSSVLSRLESKVSTPYVTWMDGDMVVLQPPDDLVPLSPASFIARAGEGYLGSDGADETAIYWQKLCELVGLDFSAFPVITSFPEARRIRAYWQSGIYTYATRTGLGRAHYEIIRKLLSSSIGSKRAGTYHQDQVSLSLAVQRLGLRHAEFQPRMNFNINVRAAKNADLLPMRDVRILHYHGSFYAPALAWALGYVERLQPDRIELIRKYVPFTAHASLIARAHKKILKLARARRVTRFQQAAVLY
jgi:hypothetical protein